MKFNSIIIPCQASVNTSVPSFSAVDIQSVFFHFTASLRERFYRRSCPCHLRGWVSKEITLYFCFFTQKNSHFSWRRLGKSRCTCKVKQLKLMIFDRLVVLILLWRNTLSLQRKVFIFFTERKYLITYREAVYEIKCSCFFEL